MSEATSAGRVATARATNALRLAGEWNLLLVVAFVGGVALRA